MKIEAKGFFQYLPHRKILKISEAAAQVAVYCKEKVDVGQFGLDKIPMLQSSGYNDFDDGEHHNGVYKKAPDIWYFHDTYQTQEIPLEDAIDHYAKVWGSGHFSVPRPLTTPHSRTAERAAAADKLIRALLTQSNDPWDRKRAVSLTVAQLDEAEIALAFLAGFRCPGIDEQEGIRRHEAVIPYAAALFGKIIMTPDPVEETGGEY